LIDHYEGTLERFAGDGLLTLFNDPLSCPDHTMRAVRMAVEMRESVEILARTWRKRGHDLGFGIGIALGYATLGKIGFERRFDYAAVGTVTNLASRLCDEAKPGQILVDQRVFNVIEETFNAQSIGTMNLKGFRRAVEAFEIIGARS
jgi:class 3 adenylate cyclase